jgi:dihydrofolate reductase
MKNISVFDHVSVDGFFAGPDGEIDWFKSIEKDDEFEAYNHQSAKGGSTLVFGRTTYEMMKSFWPTPEAAKLDPAMAKVMDESPKIVFSKTLKSVEEEPNWKNIKLVHDIDRDEILKLKETSDVTILGSGSIVQQFTNLGLIDSYTLIVVPVVLSNGKPLFAGVRKTNLKLELSRAFKNGVIVNRYKAG